MLGATISSLGPSLPFFAQNTGAALSLLGSLFALRSAGYFVGSLGGGRLTDSLPGHKLLASALITSFAVMYLIPTASQFAFLGLLLLLVGLSEGALDVVSNTLLAWTHGPRTGSFMNGMFLLAGLGGFLTPLLFAQIGDANAYRFLAMLNLPLAVLFFFLPSPPRQPQHPSEKESSSLNFPFYIVLLFLAFLYIGSEVSFGGWIFTYLMESNLGESAAAASLNSLYWLAITLGRLVAIFLAARMSLSRMILFNLIGVTLSVGLILINPRSLSVLWVGTFGVGFFLASIFPSTFAYAERNMKMTGARAGWFWASGSVGAIVFPWASGWLFENNGPIAVMFLLGGGWALALLVFGGLMRHRNLKNSRMNTNEPV